MEVDFNERSGSFCAMEVMSSKVVTELLVTIRRQLLALVVSTQIRISKQGGSEIAFNADYQALPYAH